MNKDTDEELRRLEAELLADEEEPEQQDPENLDIDQVLNDEFLQKIMAEVSEDDTDDYDIVSPGLQDQDLDATQIYREPDRVYNADYVDTEELSEALEAVEQEGSIRGLLVTAACLSTGILLVLLWWVFRYGGLLA